jgi:hypothetical protein
MSNIDQRLSTNHAQADDETLTDDRSRWTVGQIVPIGLAIGALFGLIAGLGCQSDG